MDGDVDIQDFNVLATNYDPMGVGAPYGWGQGNFDNDADIDIVDFSELASNFSPLGYTLTGPAVVKMQQADIFYGDYAFAGLLDNDTFYEEVGTETAAVSVDRQVGAEHLVGKEATSQVVDLGWSPGVYQRLSGKRNVKHEL